MISPFSQWGQKRFRGVTHPSASKCHAPETPLWSRGSWPPGHALPLWVLCPLWDLWKVAISGPRWRVGLSGRVSKWLW